MYILTFNSIFMCVPPLLRFELCVVSFIVADMTRESNEWEQAEENDCKVDIT